MTEDQTNRLLDEIQDLVYVLKNTGGTRTTGSAVSGDQGVNRIVNALGLLTTTIKNQTKTRAEQQKSMKRFTADVDRATKAQAKQAEQVQKNIAAQKKTTNATVDAAEAARRMAEAHKDEFELSKRLLRNKVQERGAASDLFKEFGQGVTATSLLKDRMNSLGEGSIAANAGFRIMTAGIEGAAKSIANYTKSIYAGQRGVDVTAKALSDFVTPIADVVSGIGTLISVLAFFTPAGKIFQGIKGLGTIFKYGKFVGPALVGVGESAKLATKYNEVGAEQSKKLYKSFQALSQVGATAEGDLGGVFKTLQTMGMSVAEIDEFNEMVRASSKDLALMGATVGTGLKNFASVAGELVQGKLGKELQEMGMTAAEQRKIAMEYMAIQSRSGQMQLKNTAQLVKDTAAFARELDLAAKLTGDSREEQAKKIRAAQMDERFRAAQREAELTNDQQAIDRLNKAAALAAKFTAMGAEEEARGIRHIAAYFAKTGQIAPGGSDEATKLFYTYGAQAIREGLEKGGIEGFAGMVKSGAKMSDSTLRLQSLLGRQGGGPLTSGVGQFEAQTLIANIERTMRESGFTGTIEDYVKTQRGKQVVDDAMAKLMVNTERVQQNTAMVLDQGVNTFNIAADLSNKASIAFDNAVQEFGRIVKLPGGGYTTSTSAASAAAVAQSRAVNGTGPIPRAPDAPANAGATQMGTMAEQRRQALASAHQRATGKPAGTALPSGPTGTTTGTAMPAGASVSDLRLKSPEAVAGGAASQNLLNLALAIQTQLGGDLQHFSALNDTYQRGPGSLHPAGKAADFTLTDPTQSARIASMIRSMPGVKNVIDEYLNPSPGATGGHIHVESFYGGGVARGPRSGYKAMLHGPEAVIPLPSGERIPVDMGGFGDALNKSIEVQMQAMADQVNRLDDMVTLMREQNMISGKILQRSQA